MNIQETEKLLMTIQEIYSPHSNKKELDAKGFEIRAKMWQRQFSDIPMVDVFRALEIHIGSSSFAPSVAELKLIVAKIQNPDLFMSGEEAWDIVSDLCISFGFDGQSEAYKHLNQRMKDAIKSSGGWWEHCYSERPQQVRANFIKTWEIKADPERQKILMPQHVVARIEQIKEQSNEPKSLPNV